MSHYSPESWADYVRGLIAPTEAGAMRAHLDGGCGPCGGAAAASEALQRLAATDGCKRELPAISGRPRSSVLDVPQVRLRPSSLRFGPI